MPVELIYFPVKGRAQLLRFLMDDNNFEYKFTVQNPAEWRASQDKFRFRALPVMKLEDGTELAQSLAIANYIARKVGIYGKDVLEDAFTDMYMNQMKDVRDKFGEMIYTNYEKGKDDFIKALPGHLKCFEDRLNENNGFLSGKKTTLADYCLFDGLDFFVAFHPPCLDTTPRLKAFFDEFGQRPKIKALREDPDYKKMKFTGSPHL